MTSERPGTAFVWVWLPGREVPASGFVELGRGLGLEEDLAAHPSVSDRLTRARTWVHSSPCP